MSCHDPHAQAVVDPGIGGLGAPSFIGVARNFVWRGTKNRGAASGGPRKKYLGEPGPSSFGRQRRLSEVTIEPIKNWGARQDLGACAPRP